LQKNANKAAELMERNNASQDLLTFTLPLSQLPSQVRRPYLPGRKTCRAVGVLVVARTLALFRIAIPCADSSRPGPFCADTQLPRRLRCKPRPQRPRSVERIKFVSTMKPRGISFETCACWTKDLGLVCEGLERGDLLGKTAHAICLKHHVGDGFYM
jgi:hypothetical protein